MPLNPLLVATDVPPIPEAKGWTARYDGAAGPLLDLSQAVPGYPPHPGLLERLGAAAATVEACAYGPIAGDDDLRASYAEHVSAIYGGSIEAEDVAITAGCNQAFVVAIMAIAKAGDAVLLPSPWYFNHNMTLDMLGIEAWPLPCRAEHGFVPDPTEAETLLDHRVRAIVLVTPNNPTGAIYPAETIGRFQELCARRGIFLILDETYRDFISPDATAPHGAFGGTAWRAGTIQLYSFSKAYCIPGHRVGAMIADRSVIGEAEKILDCVQICASRTPQRALVWGIGALAAWRAENAVEIIRRTEACRAAFAGLDGWSVDSIGAYFAYVRHPYDRPASEVAARVAAERGVLALPGPYFGPGQNRHLRIAFANVGVEALAEIPARLSFNLPLAGRLRSVRPP